MVSRCKGQILVLSANGGPGQRENQSIAGTQSCSSFVSSTSGQFRWVQSLLCSAPPGKETKPKGAIKHVFQSSGSKAEKSCEVLVIYIFQRTILLMLQYVWSKARQAVHARLT